VPIATPAATSLPPSRAAWWRCTRRLRPRNETRGGDFNVPSPRANVIETGEKPVAAFVGLVATALSPAVATRLPHCLAGPPLAKCHSYLPHTPSPELRPLVPVTRARSSLRLRPGPSQVSGGLRHAGHVARGLHPRPTPYVRASPRHSHLAPKSELSPSRTQKLSGNRRGGLFAVRLRLRRDSLASASVRAFRG
jgi:hypothetical protein